MALFYARTGIVGAIMLGFGRALGETMAVTMVIGNNPQISPSLFAPQYTMAAVHRQRVHRSGRRPLPARAGRDRPGAVHHHADRQRAVAAAHLEHGAARSGRGQLPREPARRRRHDAATRWRSGCRRMFVGVLRACPCCSRWCRWRLILFFVVTQGIQRAEPGRSSRTCRGRSAKPAAAWRTPSSAR